MRAALVAISAVLTGCSPEPAAEDQNQTSVDQRLEAVLETYIGEYGLPGVSVAYVMSDGRTGAIAVGTADREAGIDLTTRSRMLAGSIGKTFVGALIVTLEQEGEVNRDDYVAEYLGDRDWFMRLPNAEAITIQHLLTHTSGLPDHVYDEAFASLLTNIHRPEQIRPESSIEFILDEPALFVPGDGWSYSDTGYLLLGLVIESATSRDVFELINEQFIVPLGLIDTEVSNFTEISELAVGYTFDGNPFGLPERTSDVDGALLWNPAVEWTGGGLVSTPSDLARWGHTLFSCTTQIRFNCEPAAATAALSPDTPNLRYGDGVSIQLGTEYGDIYGHAGWVPGYVSSLRHYSDHQLTIAFQINTDAGIVNSEADIVGALESDLFNAIGHGGVRR